MLLAGGDVLNIKIYFYTNYNTLCYQDHFGESRI